LALGRTLRGSRWIQLTIGNWVEGKFVGLPDKFGDGVIKREQSGVGK